MGTYLQDAGQRADPLLHVLLTLRGQHEVGDLVHLQLKGVFSQTVVLERDHGRISLVGFGLFFVLVFFCKFWNKDSMRTITNMSPYDFGENIPN